MVEPTRSMSPEQAHKMLVYFNQIDPRIEVNPANVRIYRNGLGKFSPELITEVFDRFVENNAEDRRLSVGVLKKLCTDEQAHRDREEARRQIAHDPNKISLAEWHRRHPGEFLELYQKAYRERHGHDNPNPPSCVYGNGSVIEQVFDRP